MHYPLCQYLERIKYIVVSLETIYYSLSENLVRHKIYVCVCMYLLATLNSEPNLNEKNEHMAACVLIIILKVFYILLINVIKTNLFILFFYNYFFIKILVKLDTRPWEIFLTLNITFLNYFLNHQHQFIIINKKITIRILPHLIFNKYFHI